MKKFLNSHAKNKIFIFYFKGSISNFQNHIEFCHFERSEETRSKSVSQILPLAGRSLSSRNDTVLINSTFDL